MSKKNDKFLLNRLKDMYGDDFDPIMRMAANAARLQEDIDARTEKKEAVTSDELVEVNKEWERVAQFTSPKLKSIEVAGGDGMFEVHVHRSGKKGRKVRGNEDDGSSDQGD